MRRKRMNSAAEDFMPWDGAYKEMGMLRAGKGRGRARYSVAFRIAEARPEDVLSLDKAEIDAAVEEVLSGFGSLTWQLLTVNRKMDEESFRRRVMLPRKGNRRLDPMIDVYNDMVSANIPLGHNNMIREHYLVLSHVCTSPQEALNIFEKMEKRAQILFDRLCHMKVHCLTLGERLALIYSVCNQDAIPFGARHGLHAETLDPDILRKMKITTGSTAAPASLAVSKTHLQLGNRFYARTFFISSFPSVLSGNLISELTGISSQMLFSVCCEPLDTQMGFDLARDEVSGNMILTRRRDKSTLADRRAGRVVVQQEMLEHSEDAYWAKEALNVLADAKSSDGSVFLCTFLIVLYAASLTELEQDSRLLTLSASRFAFQIRVLEGMQKEGLRSAMPLAGTKVDVRRVLPARKLRELNLYDIESVLREDGLFIGMNEINDNLILLNRKNSPLPSGLIAGIRHAGKTWQVKREIWNSMISGKDVVAVIAGEKERGHYEAFIRSMGGAVIDGAAFNPMRSTQDYGVVEDGTSLKADFVAAWIAAAAGTAAGGAARESTDAAEEAKRIVQEGIRDMEELSEYLYLHGDEYPLLMEAMEKMPGEYLDGERAEGRRLNLFTVKDTASLLIVLETLWNVSVANKRKNLTTWIYIDAADEVLRIPEGARYLGHLMRISNIMNNPVTLVLQNAALFAAGEGRVALRSILPTCGYYKLLSLGPVERKMFCEELGIAPSLVPFVTNPGVGRGLVMDQSVCLPFNDHCREIAAEPGILSGIIEPAAV